MTENHTGTENRDGNNATPPREKWFGRSLAWCRKNAAYLTLFVVFVLLIVALPALSPKSLPGDPPKILNFVSFSYLVLFISLIFNFFLWVFPGSGEDTDREASLQIRMYGTLAILGMITVLGIVSLIVWGVVQPDPLDYWGR